MPEAEKAVDREELLSVCKLAKLYGLSPSIICSLFTGKPDALNLPTICAIGISAIATRRFEFAEPLARACLSSAPKLVRTVCIQVDVAGVSPRTRPGQTTTQANALTVKMG